MRLRGRGVLVLSQTLYLWVKVYSLRRREFLKTRLANILLFLSTSPVLACLLRCLLMCHLFLGYFLVRNLCRSGCRQNFNEFLSNPPFPPPFLFGLFPFLPTILSLIKWQLFEISACLKLVSVLLSSNKFIFRCWSFRRNAPRDH